MDYFIVKNSWVPKWGDKSFIRKENNTDKLGDLGGMNEMASFPTEPKMICFVLFYLVYGFSTITKKNTKFYYLYLFTSKHWLKQIQQIKITLKNTDTHKSQMIFKILYRNLETLFKLEKC